MRKYTDLQLSRILSVAAVGELGANYQDYGPQRTTVCIEQAAYSDMQDDLTEFPFYDERGDEWDAVVASGDFPRSPVAVLSWLELYGMA